MKINKHILTVLFSIILFNCFGQANYFSKVFSPYGDNPNTSFVSGNIVSNGSGYFMATIGFDTINNNKQSLLFYKIDSIGNFQKKISFTKSGYDYHTGYGSLNKTKDNGYCIVISIDSNYSPINKIIRFDNNLDTLWTKEIPHDSIFESLIQIKETSDNGFICVGSKTANSNQWDVLIIKTDSLGNLKWKKTVPIGNYSIGVFISETPDSGLLICGYRSSYIQNKGDPFLIKIDSTGNISWVKILGTNNQYDGGPSVAINNQGDYLVAYGYSTYTFPFNEAWLARINIIKYSPDGNQIWNKMYDTIRGSTSVYKIQVLPNDDFIIMGSCDQKDIIDNRLHFESFLFKFNSNGDSLWRKNYFYSQLSVDENFLYDNVLNPNGSITACGHVAGDTIVPYQKIWIVKTDTNGYAPGCNPTGINELLFSKQEIIKAFPNPSTNQTTISYPQLTNDGELQIYNTLGQLVYQEKLSKASSQKEINTQNFKAGLYKIIIKEKGILKGQVSLVKE